MPNTKIIATLGPASSNLKILKQMIKAGLNIVRLNFSHGNYQDHTELIKLVRQASLETQTPISIMQDLQGPKIRVGKMPKEGYKFTSNKLLILSTAATEFHPESKNQPAIIPVQYKKLHRDVKPSDLILIEDGLIQLTVQKIVNNEIHCLTLNPGTIKTHKGINAPTASISANPLTSKDLKDLDFGLKQNVDFVAISFVRKASDIDSLRKKIQDAGGKAKIIAKIERSEAITELENIIKSTDAVMVARGDLGVEIPYSEVPLIQLRIIELAKKHGKPSIVATQMLQSMIENPIATRAEISDVATAIFEQADAIMLSNETAVGKFPVKAIETLTSVAKTIEQNLSLNKINTVLDNDFISREMCKIAIKLAEDLNAIIISVTDTGFTTRQLSSYRSPQTIITITSNQNLINQLNLNWGIHQIHYFKPNPNNKLQSIKNFLSKQKILKKNQIAVIIHNVNKSHKIIETVIN